VSAKRLTPDEIAQRWPRLFHMAERGSWPSIRQHGLLSTTALLDLFGIQGESRRSLEDVKRLASHRITHPVHGTAVIRDNKPINETVLRRTLAGMTEVEWYRAINGRVFFWLNEDRLDRLRQTPAYRGQHHDLLVIGTRRFLARYAKVIELSPYNSGAVHAGSRVQRGTGMYTGIADYPWAEHLRRNRKEPIVELTVPYAIPDVAEYVLEIRRI
jgi:hypothetical protein